MLCTVAIFNDFKFIMILDYIIIITITWYIYYYYIMHYCYASHLVAGRTYTYVGSDLDAESTTRTRVRKNSRAAFRTGLLANLYFRLGPVDLFVGAGDDCRDADEEEEEELRFDGVEAVTVFISWR